MKFLNAQQLAFVLDIKKDDARAMMCNAWTRDKGMDKVGFAKDIPGTIRNVKNKVEDRFPDAMPIEILAKELNLPHLQMSCDDIENNYLIRKASKKYILWDYPEKQIKKFETEVKSKPYKLAIPPALKSMLPTKVQHEIYAHWKKFHELNLTYEEYENFTHHTHDHRRPRAGQLRQDV